MVRFISGCTLALLLLTGIPLRALPEGTAPALEKETFALINVYRVQNGMIPLRWSEEVASEARAHSRDMATHAVDFGHDGFRDRVRHLKAVIPDVQGCGENVFFTDQKTGVATLARGVWLKSPHHLANIRGRYTLSGLGAWTNADGVVYFTQFFVDAEPVPAP